MIHEQKLQNSPRPGISKMYSAFYWDINFTADIKNFVQFLIWLNKSEIVEIWMKFLDTIYEIDKDM